MTYGRVFSLLEAVRAFRELFVDQLPDKRAKLGMVEHPDHAEQHHPRMAGDLKPYLSGKGAVSVELEPLSSDKPHRYVYEVTSPELIAVQSYLSAIKARAIEQGHQR